MATFTITVVTDMNWPRLCVAGVSEYDGWVRPVVPRGELTAEHLLKQGRWLAPGDVISVPMFPKPKRVAPHTEDHLCQLTQHDLVRTLDLAAFGETLRRYTATSVAAAFHGQLHDRAALPGAPCPSLAAVVATEAGLYVDEQNGKFRLHLDDGAQRYTHLPVRDLRLMRYLQQRAKLGRPPGTKLLNDRLRAASEIVVCLGLTRPWAKEGGIEQCWLQVNGVFTFPADLLGGRQWHEFPEAGPVTEI